MAKIGLYGGAFNPIHNGHMAVAAAAMAHCALDRLIWIPSGNAPHKSESVEATRDDRLAMVRMATAPFPRYEVSEYELERTETCYSADTVEHFASLYPKDELFFLIGDDSYRDLPTWYQPERIVRCATLLVFPRLGLSVQPPAIAVPMERVTVASSDLREKINAGKDVENFLPNGVYAYIIEHNLYRGRLYE